MNIPETANPTTKKKLRFWHKELEKLPEKFTVVWKNEYHVRITWVEVIEEGDRPEGDLYDKLKNSKRVSDTYETNFMAVDFWPTKSNVTEVSGRAADGRWVEDADELSTYLESYE